MGRAARPRRSSRAAPVATTDAEPPRVSDGEPRRLTLEAPELLESKGFRSRSGQTSAAAGPRIEFRLGKPRTSEGRRRLAQPVVGIEVVDVVARDDLVAH